MDRIDAHHTVSMEAQLSRTYTHRAHTERQARLHRLDLMHTSAQRGVGISMLGTMGRKL